MSGTSSAQSFVSGSIPRQLLRFAGPFMLGVLVQNLYGAVDLWVVGRYATTIDVSAVTIGSQLMSIVTQLIIGLATGITVLVGRYFGAQEHDRLRKVIGSSTLLLGGISVVLMGVYLFCNRPFVALMNTPPEAVAATQGYLLACTFGIVFITGYNIINSMMTGLGDSKTPFLFILVACGINVVLDIILVKYVGMGALGAAIATTVAQAGSFLFALLFLWKRGLGFPFSLQDFRFSRQENKELVGIGAPVAVQNILVGLSFLFIIAIINQMGLVASAAVGVVEKLINFLFVPAIGMGTSVATASAQNLGAGKYKRARESLGWGIVIALIPSILICLFCQFFGSLLTGIFTQDQEVVLLAADYLRSYIFDVIMVAFVFSFNGYFNSRGKSWFSLMHSLVTTFAVRVPAAYLLSRMANTSL